MVPIRESFSNLNNEQIKEAIKKSPDKTREEHEKAAQSFNSLGGNINNIKAMAVLLLSGKDIAILAEGPLSRLEDDDRKAYAGYALVAREYKRISGRELDIVPTGIRQKKVAFGDSFHIDKNGKQSKEELQEMATVKIHELYGSLGK